ncbi:MAG: phage tail protein [Kiloniellaceae bacterium]
MPDVNIGDFSTTPADNTTVMSVNIDSDMQAAQIDDAIRSVLAVLAGADFGTKTLKVDTIAESTADAGVTIDGLLIKDGEIPSLAALLSSSVFQTGDRKSTWRKAADPGWLLENGETIGSAASAGTHQGAQYEALFTFLWDNYDDTTNPVVGGRGESAAADWTSNKAITLPDSRNRSTVAAGGAPGFTVRTAGETGGAETHALTAAENGPHGHPFRKCDARQTSAQSYPNGGFMSHTNINTNYPAYAGAVSATNGEQIGGSGLGLPHNIMQPFIVATYQIKT